MEQYKIDFINDCNNDLMNEIDKLIAMHDKLEDKGVCITQNLIYSKLKLLIKYKFDFTDSSLEIKQNNIDLMDLILQCIKDDSYSLFNIIGTKNYTFIYNQLRNQKHILDFINRQMFIHNPIDMTELFKSREWSYHEFIEYI